MSQYTDSFSFEHQYLASLGYVVLISNPRGSSGYGEAFCRAIFADWGNKDYQDVMAGVDHVLSLGFIDDRRMGVGGWSYGGILTNYIITKNTRFAAAIAGASEADMFSAFGYDDLQRWWVSELGHPWDQGELYRKLSPIYDVKKVKTPTLVMCGEKDFRCPLPQSEQLYLALKTLGKETALIIYPGQSHSIRRPSYRDRSVPPVWLLVRQVPERVDSRSDVRGNLHEDNDVQLTMTTRNHEKEDFVHFVPFVVVVFRRLPERLPGSRRRGCSPSRIQASRPARAHRRNGNPSRSARRPRCSRASGSPDRG